MTYQEFVDHLLVFLWKQNDFDLKNSIDNLIKMGTSRLNRELNISRREVTNEALIAASNEIPLPDDFRHMVALTRDDVGYRSSTIWMVQQLRAANYGVRCDPFYAISGRTLYVSDTIDPANPLTYTISYRTNLPDFKETDTSWMAEEFLDVYTYAVLAETAPFLREDERLPLWQQLATAGIGSIVDEDKFLIAHGGSPLQQRQARYAP